MNAYLVTIREPKEQTVGFQTTRGVAVAETAELAIKAVKEGCYTNGIRHWHPKALFDFILLGPGFYLH